jgi:hypothetical protein
MTAIPSLGFALKKPSAKPINYIAAIYSGVITKGDLGALRSWINWLSLISWLGLIAYGIFFIWSMKHSISPDSPRESYIFSLPIFELMLLVGMFSAVTQSFSLYVNFGSFKQIILKS